MKSSIKALVLLMALLLPALFLGLDHRPVYKIQEVRIAEAAREMLVSGDWVVPRFNGELRLQKPPLPYWLTATSYKLFGVSESATRLPSVLFGLLSALLLWTWVKRESGVVVAANAVLAMVVSYIGLRYFRSGEADATLLFFITAATMLGYDLLQGTQRAWQKSVFGLVLGLGFLTKGPAALAIPVASLAVSSFVERRTGRARPSLKAFFSWSGFALLLIAAFGWYLLILLKFPEIAQQFFGKQVDETFISGTHAKPFWWYLANSFEFFAPWSVLLIPAGVMAYRQRGSEMMPLLRFAWIWLAVVFALLTLTVNKQVQYALLFLPPIAIIIGHYLAASKGSYSRVNRVLFGGFCVLVLAAVTYTLRKLPISIDLALWLAFPFLLLLAQRVMRDSLISSPVFFVAAATVAAFLCGEAYFSKEPKKVAAQALMTEAVKYPALFQNEPKPGRGEFSFYGSRVVRPIDTTQADDLLRQSGEIWVVGEDAPVLDNGVVEVAKQEGDLRLFRVTLKVAPRVKLQ